MLVPTNLCSRATNLYTAVVDFVKFRRLVEEAREAVLFSDKGIDFPRNDGIFFKKLNIDCLQIFRNPTRP